MARGLIEGLERMLASESDDLSIEEISIDRPLTEVLDETKHTGETAVALVSDNLTRTPSNKSNGITW